MHRVTECKASRDYRLWLRFEDGLEGSVFLGNLLDLGPFSAWRDVDQFCRAAVDREAATVVWYRISGSSSTPISCTRICSPAGRQGNSMRRDFSALEWPVPDGGRGWL